MAGRILGMGDVVALVEKAQEEIDEEEAEADREKLFARGRSTSTTCSRSSSRSRRWGSLKDLVKQLPGQLAEAIGEQELDDKQLDRARRRSSSR